MQTKYVLGFLFSLDKKQVALIEKRQPDWQAGFLNGIGGKIEPNELPLDAMIREFKEETGYEFTDWTAFNSLQGYNSGTKSWIVYTFRGFGDVDKVNTTESEIIYVVNVSDIRTLKVINNLQWLIPLALDTDEIFTHTEYNNFFNENQS